MAISKSAKIQTEIEKVTAKINEQQARLKELEQEGIVSRNTYPGESRVDYSLTEQGKDLAPVMAAVHNWSDKWC